MNNNTALTLLQALVGSETLGGDHDGNEYSRPFNPYFMSALNVAIAAHLPAPLEPLRLQAWHHGAAVADAVKRRNAFAEFLEQWATALHSGPLPSVGEMRKALGLVLAYFGNVNVIGFDNLVAHVAKSLVVAGEDPDEVGMGVTATNGPLGLGNIVTDLDEPMRYCSWSAKFSRGSDIYSQTYFGIARGDRLVLSAPKWASDLEAAECCVGFHWLTMGTPGPGEEGDQVNA